MKTKRHQVAGLEGALLDAAVAKAEGRQWHPVCGQYVVRCYVSGVIVSPDGIAAEPIDASYFEPKPRPWSTDWIHGGPIIERERIALHPPETRRPGVNWEWQADCYGTIDSPGEHYTTEEGETPLIAAMRAYVASRFGDDIELPT